MHEKFNSSHESDSIEIKMREKYNRMSEYTHIHTHTRSR